MAADVTVLRDVLAGLSDSDQVFARSLIDQAAGRGLSPAQATWVDKLVLRAITPKQEPINVMPLVDFLHDANVKRPALLLMTDDAQIRLSVAGPASRTPGYVVVTSPERAFTDRRFLGRIGPDGLFEPSLSLEPETATAITAALQAMALDPAGTAARYGKKLGRCCFCGLELSDGLSLEVGYGKICARKYNLPYGANR